MAVKKIEDFVLIDGTLRFLHNNDLLEVTIAKTQRGYTAQIKNHLISKDENPICQHVMNDSPSMSNEDPQLALEQCLLKHYELFHAPKGVLQLVK